MMQRERGNYWVCWSNRADAETTERLSGPLLGMWDGEVWWFVRIDRYYFDTELIVLSERLVPPRTIDDMRTAMAG
jgi:hypothetical protein